MPDKKQKKKKRKTNPNKVNQHTLADPRQALFFSMFFDRKHQYFSNAYKSAMAAGFEKSYALNLKNLMPAWLSEKLEEMADAEMVQKAKRNLNEILDIPHQEDMIGMFGPVINKDTGLPFKRINTGILKIKQGTSEFVAERLDRKKFGKESPKGGNLTFNFTHIQEDKDEYQ